jgi:hypothetical protein
VRGGRGVARRLRLNPDARFDDEVQRLAAAANADVTFRLQERSEPQAGGEDVGRPCDCCKRPATHDFVVSYRGDVITGAICEEHGNAVARERLRLQDGRRTVGAPFATLNSPEQSEKAAKIERALTDPNTKPKFERIREPEPHEIARDTLEPDRGIHPELF